MLQVRQYGFSAAVGQVSFPVQDSSSSGRRPYSNTLANIMDLEANRIIFEAYKITEKLVNENRVKLQQV